MSVYQIRLKPVYSCPASALPAGITLPDGWKGLAWHQVETFHALSVPEVDVVFNHAMTGDGKSLAAYLRPFSEYYCAIGLYPTNELARDQETQLRDYMAQFQPRHRPRVVRLSGADLEIYAENEGLRKSAAIATRTGQSEIKLY